jgi:hypothetical protein
MQTFVMWCVLFLIIVLYNKLAWTAYLHVGVARDKQTADLFDFFHSALFTLWLWYVGHPILAAIGVGLWLKTNLDKDFQKKLATIITTMKHQKTLDDKKGT